MFGSWWFYAVLAFWVWWLALGGWASGWFVLNVGGCWVNFLVVGDFMVLSSFVLFVHFGFLGLCILFVVLWLLMC